MPAFGSILGDDPLGIALKDRAQRSREEYNLNEGWGHPAFGPLPDPAWEGLFQALKERNVDQLVGGAVPGSNAFVGVKQLTGRHGASEIGPQGFEPASGEKQMLPGYGAPDNRDMIINGLNQAYTPMGQGYQSHEQFMARNAPVKTGAWGATATPTNHPPRIIKQRGSTGMNQSQRYSQPNPNE